VFSQEKNRIAHRKKGNTPKIRTGKRNPPRRV